MAVLVRVFVVLGPSDREGVGWLPAVPRDENPLGAVASCHMATRNVRGALIDEQATRLGLTEP